MNYSLRYLFLVLTILFLFTACGEEVKPNIETTGVAVIDELNQKIAKAPNDIELLRLRCEAYSKHEYFEEAVQDAETVLRLDSNNLASYRTLANMYFENNQSRPAIKTLELGIERFNAVENEDVQFAVNYCMLMLIEIQLITQQYNEALITTDNLLKKDPYMPEALMWKGQIFEESGDTLQAGNYYKQVIEIDAEYKDAYLKLGLLASKYKDPISIDYFKNALRIDSMDLKAMLGIAQFYHQTGDLEQATNWYEKTIIKHHQDYEPAYNYGLLCLEQGDLAAKNTGEDAKKWYETAHQQFNVTAKVEPTFGEAYFYRGKASERLGNLEDAMRDYEQTLVFENQLEAISGQIVKNNIERLKKEIE
ncbi:MAG: hypothetical protein MK212_08280 [Saprospiraceae bacterium]|nr:hypothetical protein [Saprospiraceae bacterium]